VTAEDLEDAPGILQGRIGPRRLRELAAPRGEAGRVVELELRLVRRPPARLGVVAPALRVVDATPGIEPGEDAVQVLGVAVLLGDQGRRVGVGDDVVAEIAPLLQDVADQAAEEHDVGAGAQRRVEVGQRRRAGEPRVDVQDLRPPELGCHHEAEAHRVALGHVRAHDQHGVGVAHVHLGGRRPPRARAKVPRPGTVELCQMRAWFSSQINPSARHSFRWT
jgi:hypothetical protein